MDELRACVDDLELATARDDRCDDAEDEGGGEDVEEDGRGIHGNPPEGPPFYSSFRSPAQSSAWDFTMSFNDRVAA